jgi:hypothetical protein
MISINREDKIQFIKDGLSKESLDNLLVRMAQCISGLSVFVVSGDVFYTLSFYLRTLRTMSRFGWGERVVVDIKKKNNNN